jgi:uncharacterized repeat protein (TIGR03803 family)
MHHLTNLDHHLFGQVTSASRESSLQTPELCSHRTNRLHALVTACCMFLLLTASAIVSPAQTFTTVHSFNGTDGNNSQASLLQATNGYFYGVTVHGGANNDGTIFAMRSGGALMTIHSFNGTDGISPWPGLAQGSNGNLYGTTNAGGANANGTVFTITPSGTFRTLYNFCSRSNCKDGSTPYGALVQGSDGNFYGTTLYGGTAGSGTVFRVTPGGVLSTLHSFQNNSLDGAYPYAALIQASDGNFYGTTFSGGEGDVGTIFRISSDGTLTIIYNFCASGFPCPDGGNPQGGLVQSSNGYLYGTAARGGDFATCNLFVNCGTVYRVSLNGALTTLHKFVSTDGLGPLTSMIQGSNGVLYGVTTWGGSSNVCADGCGTIFAITPTGDFATLHNFCSESGCADGATPVGGLIQATSGAFYGTTGIGGANNMGEVYGLSVGFGPSTKTSPKILHNE